MEDGETPQVTDNMKKRDTEDGKPETKPCDKPLKIDIGGNLYSLVGVVTLHQPF